MAHRKGRKRRSALHHYFIPGAHNAHRPHFLRIPTAAAVAGIIVLLFVVTLGMERLIIRSPSPQVGAVVAAVLVDLANADRAEYGAGSLTVNPLLEKAAQMKAEDMVAREYFAHDSPEGLKPWHWFEKAGYAYSYAGENLAVFFADSHEVEEAWMNSPKHRANILGNNFTEVGIALAQGVYQGRETTFVVQMFASPAEALAKAGGPTVALASTETADEPEVAAVITGPSEDANVAGASTGAAPVVLEESDTFIALEAQVAPLAAVAEDTRPVGAVASRQSSPLWHVLTAPKTMLQYIYIGLGALILLAISLLFMAETRRFHVPSLVRGLGLLALIVVILFGGTVYFSGELLIV